VPVLGSVVEAMGRIRRTSSWRAEVCHRALIETLGPEADMRPDLEALAGILDNGGVFDGDLAYADSRRCADAIAWDAVLSAVLWPRCRQPTRRQRL
jgi:hypothetical protein